MNNPPLVSIIIPVYNGEKYIEETINSVLFQTYENWELIIINNASTDGSLNIIHKFVKLDNRIKVLNLENNSGGPADPRNIGIKNANGKYLAFLDADDLWEKNKIEKQITHIEKEQLDVAYCKIEFINSSGKKSGTIKVSKLHTLLSKIFGSSFALLAINPIALSSCIIKNQSGFYFRNNPNLQSIEDWFMWIDLSISGKQFGLLNERLVLYRLHESSVSSINGITQYYRSFHLYSALLVEEKIGFLKYLILFSISIIRVLKFRFFGRHS